MKANWIREFLQEEEERKHMERLHKEEHHEEEMRVKRKAVPISGRIDLGYVPDNRRRRRRLRGHKKNECPPS